MFGYQQEKFAVNPTACQVLISIILIAQLSFWVDKPFLPSIIESLDQYKQKGYIQKLKTNITADVIHSGYPVVKFLNQLMKDIWVKYTA